MPLPRAGRRLPHSTTIGRESRRGQQPDLFVATNAAAGCPRFSRVRELIAEEEAAKADTYRARRQAEAIDSRHGALPGDDNGAFLRLAHDLNRIGMSHADIRSTLRQAAGHGRHPSERRAQIRHIMRSLRRSPQRLAA